MPRIQKGDPQPKGAGPTKGDPNRKLTTKQKKFADLYLVPGTTLTEAARKAGYGSPEAAGSSTLAIPHVRAYVEARQAKLQAKHDLTLDMVIQEFRKIGFQNMDDYVQDDGHGRPQFRLMGDIGRDKLAVVTEITVDTRKEFEGRGEDREHVANVERVRFKLADKVNALTQLGKHLGMFPRDTGGGGDDPEGNGDRIVTVRVLGGLPKSKVPK